MAIEIETKLEMYTFKSFQQKQVALKALLAAFEPYSRINHALVHAIQQVITKLLFKV